MTTRSIERAALLLKRDLTLGTLFDRLEKVHGDRQLVDGGRRRARPHLRAGRPAGPALVRRASPPRSQPGDVVVVATPNGYEQLLLCCAAARAGAHPGAGERPDAPGRDRPRRRATAAPRSCCGRRGRGRRRRPARRAAPGRARRRRPRSSTRRAPPASRRASRSRHRALVGQVAGAALWPARLHRDEAVVALPVAHIMGFAVLVGLAWPASRPTCCRGSTR